MAKRKQKKGSRRFTPEYKEEALRMWRESGKSVQEAAAELGIGVSSLSRWRKAAEGIETEVVDVKLSESEEVKRLRKRVRELEQDKEILKKAAAFFAKESE